MSKQHRWLAAQTERWSGDGIITIEQATRIRTLYPETPAVAWGMIVFFGIGAVVAGLGVTLLVAYNWDALPKASKLALIFGKVAAAHAAGLWLRANTDWRRHVGEALGLLGTMLFGSGIWLVAQIYNIDEHYPTGFLIWGLGALAMAWALPSIGQAIIAVVMLTIWNLCELGDYGVPMDWVPLALFAAIAPLAWRMRSAVLTAVLLAALYVLLLSSAGHWNSFAGAMLTALSLSALLLAVARVVDERWLPGHSRAVVRFFGYSGFLLCAYIMAFAEAADELVDHRHRYREVAAMALVHRWAWFALAVGAWAWTGWMARSRRITLPLEEWLVPTAVLFAQGIAIPWLYRSEWLVAGVFNAAFLFIAAMWVDRGCREGRLLPTALGSVLVALLVFARYFDLFESLAVRGAVFIVLGAALFAEGLYFRRMRRGDETARAAS